MCRLPVLVWVLYTYGLTAVQGRHAWYARVGIPPIYEDISKRIGDTPETSTPEDTEPVPDGDPGSRLFLTELIEEGKISEALERSLVSGGPFPDDVTSHAGFLTVNKQHNSNLFFWFFKAQTNYESSPVILWLQGGPGDTSLIGTFQENGPFFVSEDGSSLVPNPNSWHKDHSVIYIDSPVGAGFSFTDSDDGYATKLPDVISSLYLALTQFFKLFPELQNNDFFIAGESYAGKWVPMLGENIHTNNQQSDFKINLKGIAVDSGFTDPINMIGWSEMGFNLGLIDTRIRDQMEAMEKEGRKYILQNDIDNTMNTIGPSYGLFTANSNYSYFYNFLQYLTPPNENLFVTFVNRADVRARLHVGDAKFVFLEGAEAGSMAAWKLGSEYFVSARSYLEKLLDHYHVLYYSGQLDLVCAYSMSVKMYQTLQWSAADAYKTAERQPWFVNGELAGYMKSAGNFTEVLVRNAGHMVPADQPVWALDLITRFTHGGIKSKGDIVTSTEATEATESSEPSAE